MRIAFEGLDEDEMSVALKSSANTTLKKCFEKVGNSGRKASCSRRI
jgi:hypothetical protein